MSDNYVETTVRPDRYNKKTSTVTALPPAATPTATPVATPAVNPINTAGIQSMFSTVMPAAAPKPAGPVYTTPNPILTLPSLQMPSLKMSDGSSVSTQLNKLNSTDNLTNQQSLTRAHEAGTASGGIHSSQFGGAAQRAMTDVNLPIATIEANRVAQEDTTNFANKTQEAVAYFTNKTSEALQTYEKQYAERINQLGYSAEKQAYMAQANTSLSNAFLASMTSLTNNTDLDIGQEVIDRMASIFNTAMDNNNLILNMGFTY